MLIYEVSLSIPINLITIHDSSSEVAKLLQMTSKPTHDWELRLSQEKLVGRLAWVIQTQRIVDKDTQQGCCNLKGKVCNTLRFVCKLR